MSANELVGIELQLRGYDGVMADMRALDQMLNGFRGRKNKLQIEADISNAKKQVIALEGELNKLNSVKLTLDEHGKSSEGLNNKIKETRERLRDARQAVKEFQYALKNLASMSFQQVFSKISSSVAHLGSAMQSAGNALTRLTNPFANFTKGIVMGAGYRALNKFTEGLSNGFNRYDIMKKYPKIMASFGYSAEESQKSIDALDKSVRGLPTGLDEMVDLAQRFTATTGDIDKGTKLAIAANNAFLASMSTDTQKYQGMMQLQDVLGGKNMTAREWNSLYSSMTPAIVKMGESLGYTSKNMDEWVQKVRDGKVSNEDFIDTLIKIGNEGGVLEKMAQESKDTWQAFFANVGNAASRMTAGIITSLDEIVKTFNLVDDNGLAIESVNQLLAGKMIPAIDGMTASVKGWIKAHPEEIAEFFKSLKQIDFKGLVSGFGEALIGVANLIQRIAGFLNGKDLSWVGKGMLYGNILGNFLTISGGLLKGSRHLIGGIGAGGYTLFRGIKGIKKYGLMGWLGKMMTVGESATAGQQAIDTATKTAPKMGKFMTGLSKVFTGWAQIATMIGGSAFVAWGSTKLFTGTAKNLKEMVDTIKTIDWDVGAKAIGGMTTFLGAMLGLSALAGHFAGASGTVLVGEAVVGIFTTLAAAIADVDMFLMKRTFKHFAELAGYLNEAIDSFNNIGTVSNVTSKVSNAMDSFNEIIRVLKPKRTDKQTVEGGMPKLGKDIVDSLKNLKDSLGSIKDSVSLINELNGIKLEDSNIESLTSRIGTSIGFIAGMFDRMPESMKSGDAVSTSSNMLSSLTNFQNTFNSVKKILEQIPTIILQMQGLVRHGQLTQLESDMDTLGNTLTKVYQSLQGIGAGEYFTSNIDNFRTGLKSLKFAIKHLQEIGGMEVDNSMVTKIQNIIQNISKAFSQDQISALSETINTFKKSIEDALKSFEELNGDIEINVKVKLNKGFDSSVKSASKKIRGAKGQIQAALDSVPSTFTKRITAHIIATAVVSGIGKVRRIAEDAYNAAKNSSTGGRISNQGVLYRKKGGSIFKPRGTDKVPAMLTEGEYVHKKQAVDFFGVDFMRKVNNLDVKGAMNALLTKAGTSVGVGRQSIVNNTVNNNQRITQNINTNNPNFAGARMGRFVGAL